jgi:hypothetical protein
LFIKKALDLVDISFYNVEESNIPGEKKKWDSAVPGKPAFTYYSLF